MNKSEIQTDLQQLMYTMNGNDFEYDFECLPGFNPSFESIACSSFGIDKKELDSKSRKREVVSARYIIFDYLDRLTKATLMHIGSKYNKDHATTLYGIRIHKQLIEQKDKFYLKFVKDFNHQLSLEQY